MGSPTKRQKSFIRAYLAGEPPSRAYALAGYSVQNMTPSSIATEAQRILRSPNVAPIVAEAKRDVARQAAWDRTLAIRRTQAVNDEAYQRILDGDISKDTADVFMRTEHRLSDLVGIPTEMRLREEGIRNDMERLNELTISFKPSWEAMRQVLQDADDTEVSE